jgi:hypothetical protein
MITVSRKHCVSGTQVCKCGSDLNCPEPVLTNGDAGSFTPVEAHSGRCGFVPAMSKSGAYPGH